VLRCVTIPNIRLNGVSASAPVRLLAGDWCHIAVRSLCLSLSFFYLPDSVAQASVNEQFDVILASETLYFTHLHARFLVALKALLRKPHGVAYPPMLTSSTSVHYPPPGGLNSRTYISSKAYYFGTGGGTMAFAECVRQDGQLRVSCDRRVEDGTSSIREVLSVRWAP
jgi:hypothetical protein